MPRIRTKTLAVMLLALAIAAVAAGTVRNDLFYAVIRENDLARCPHVPHASNVP